MVDGKNTPPGGKLPRAPPCLSQEQTALENHPMGEDRASWTVSGRAAQAGVVLMVGCAVGISDSFGAVIEACPLHTACFQRCRLSSRDLFKEGTGEVEAGEGSISNQGACYIQEAAKTDESLLTADLKGAY